ncbi:ribitol 5-phosphate transferase FKRP [Bombyx mori]|uniref:FKRP stem domain-containing protein n=1 Tax=Bombyx mori TaxID=7091 RepID=A0A8R2ASR1_BOMMO|nr:fukutin-related protein [Bombyx mori]
MFRKIVFHRLLRGQQGFKLQFFVSIAVLVLLCVYLFSLLTEVTYNKRATDTESGWQKKPLSSLVTVVFRQFEEADNDVADSVLSFVSAFPDMQVLVVCERSPYPPIELPPTNSSYRNVKILSLDYEIDSCPYTSSPLSPFNIETEYTLFVPDSVRVKPRVLHQAVIEANANPLHVIAIGIGFHEIKCQRICWNYRDWTLKYTKDSTGTICDAVTGPHALLIKTEYLSKVPDPIALPFPESLYLQTYVKMAKVQVLYHTFGPGRKVLKTLPEKQIVAEKVKEQRSTFYKKYKMKIVVGEDGTVHEYGCAKDTPRCFPTVKGKPSYVYSDKHTPPCCLRNMREVTKHVLDVLEQAGVRCWLETSSLLGAVVDGNVLVWADHVELGIYSSDIDRVPYLQRGGTDADGFVWERATKGHYYSVSLSAINKANVLILPFTSQNGTMWPADWVLAHQREFPERHLHPLAQIPFAYVQAPAPNDAHAFLDLKLGPNAVEKYKKLGAKLLYP